MDPEQLVEALRADPFVPFTIRMTTGRAYRVDNPELALLHPNRRSVAVVNDARAFNVLAVSLMASLEYHEG